MKKKLESLKSYFSKIFPKQKPDRIKIFILEFENLLKEKKFQEVVERYNKNLYFYERFNPELYFYHHSAKAYLKEESNFFQNLFYKNSNKAFFWNFVFALTFFGFLYWLNKVINIIK